MKIVGLSAQSMLDNLENRGFLAARVGLAAEEAKGEILQEGAIMQQSYARCINTNCTDSLDI